MQSFFALACIVSIAQADPHAHLGKNPPQLNCPPGFALTGKKCEQIVTQTPQSVCSTGTPDNGSCVLYAPSEKVCPPGTVPSGKECTATDVTPAFASCPPGYQESGKAGCVTTKSLPIVEVCEAGTMSSSGQCVLIETAEKITSTYCPTGYIDEGKGCMQVTQYDCSPPIHGKEAIAPPPILPPPMPAPIFGGYRGKKRMLGAKKYGPVYAPVPIPVPPPLPVPAPLPLPPPVAIPPPPPPKINVVQQLCQRKDFANPIVETKCPPGYTEVGKKCVLKKIFPPVQRCSNGGPVSQCSETLTAPHLYSCHTGILVGDQCKHTSSYPYEFMCPRGFQMLGHECAQFLSPQIVCPPGLALEGNICIGRNYAEPTGLVVVQCTGKGCFQNI
eukprot:Gregarina_sp_Poly_1__470@NODE_1112_length_5051_cov_170_608146_g771_i0_p2_GENE_NODE_1112_length_5051_cov_170_608146_g771_i0NODE_1112_length_5051_cov_170_608146_g771_i0_p2_ORF_typecomplete_len387_score33_38CxC7/PF18866_1/7_9e02CxC7/PF18866_1/5_6e03CxC7/PF18866_1/33CxC7/PF18866_1/4_7e02CxC7/PF18866_1/6_2cEGF/PF12662_7/1_4cEGF/PF12662_7/1_5e02cEGF/PF12662_7/4_2cEGF/PF12662_7/1_5e02cEGF/PF12662_7/5_9cEGF/PF12662_7/29cEGF/PF12662_7/1_9e03FOG_N/PF15888_5/60FOG_N/PF15888_5/19FOG_N/PF15888_5/3_9e03FOG_N/